MNTDHLDTAKSVLKSKSLKYKTLTGDAGTRQYFRLETESKTALMCVYHDQDESFQNFLSTSHLLKKHEIKTPEILYNDFPIMILEDLGDLSLEAACLQSLDHKNSLLNDSIEILAKLQNLPSDFSFKKSEQTFTQEKFVWELNFAQKHLSALLRLRDYDLQEEFQSLCNQISNQKQTFTHRDFHSRNVMVFENQIYLIDYQDARKGPYTYDLVSMIEDTYIDLDTTQKEDLKLKFLDLTTSLDKETFQCDYDFQKIQRSLKACGSFAYLKNERGSQRYLKYIKPSTQNALEALKGVREKQPLSQIEIFCNEILNKMGEF